MHTRAGRWERSQAAWVVAGILAMPAIAEAQLFPNLPTRKRERVDCAHENPAFRAYRHEYYGYYPTCWRRFPPGWGCPSPEAPNWPEELIRAPLDESLATPGAGQAPASAGALDRDGQRPRDLPGGAEIPPLPRDERSPFNLDLGAPAVPPPLDLDRRAPRRPAEPGAVPPSLDRDPPAPGLPPEAPAAPPEPDRLPEPPFTLPVPGADARPARPADAPAVELAAADRDVPPLAAPGRVDYLPAPMPGLPPGPIGPRLTPSAPPPVSMVRPRTPRRGPILGWLTGRGRTRR